MSNKNNLSNNKFDQKMVMINTKHSFHLVDPSPWPIISAFSALMLTVGTVMYMHGYKGGGFLLLMGFFMILFMMFC
jgi:cytochrome c oxidase subunit 3